MNILNYFSMRRLYWQLLFGLAVIAVLLAGHAFGQEGADKREAWEKALPHIQQAERESLATIDEAVVEINRRFDEAAPKIQPWVVDLLGIWGKVDFVVGSTQNLVNGTAQLFDNLFGTKLGNVAGADRFEKMARTTFTEKVFDPADMEEAIKAAFKTYGEKTEAIAAKLFVAINADVPDAAVPLSSPVLEVNLPRGVIRHIDAALNDATSAAADDFLLTVGKEAIGQVGGNILAGILLTVAGAAGEHAAMSNDPVTAVPAAVTAAVAFGSGIAVSYGLDKLQQWTGHEPVGILAAAIAKRLASGRDAILNGNENTGRNYSLFVLHRLANPNGLARAVCGQAVIDMEARTDLGLKWVLKALYFQRVHYVRTAAWKAIHGQYAPLPSGFFQDLVADQSPDDLVKVARTWLVVKGKKH